jgi:hypothetical protein
MKLSEETTKAYLAGFLDGDGPSGITHKSLKEVVIDLAFKSVRISITFFQSTKRHGFLMQLQEMLPGGTLRNIDGISEYAIVGATSVQRVCEQLLPYLKIKQRQATLVIEITGPSGPLGTRSSRFSTFVPYSR